MKKSPTTSYGNHNMPLRVTGDQFFINSITTSKIPFKVFKSQNCVLTMMGRLITNDSIMKYDHNEQTCSRPVCQSPASLKG